MKWLFKKHIEPLRVDMHSHFIPGIDDGASTLHDSIELISLMKGQGFEKLITTPHIHPKYPNTNDVILRGLEQVQKALLSKNIVIELEAAAEYYVDEQFIKRLETNEALLSFGNRYVLIECSFTVKPLFFESVIYKLRDKGYNPILAHPERYQFLEGSIEWLSELKNTGILFQVTLASLAGYYGSEVKKMGQHLIKRNFVEFLASDLHKISQIDYLQRGLKTKEAQSLIESANLMNDGLL